MALGDGREPIFKFHSKERYHPLAVESVEKVGEKIELRTGSRSKGIDLGVQYWLWYLYNPKRFLVAHDSHANYFEPRKGQTDFDDEADGRGEELDAIDWREFGPWATWAGRWGNSRGPGESPQSPGSQGSRWKAPHLYHSEAHHQR